ncbi:MAG TPA: MMPL family transporter [Mycobacteriales bacterium]|nr:MMPL family transporter [Mycobacteriales bacterium]
MTRSAASLLTGHRTKFLVLVLWLVVVGVAGPLAGKLTGAEKNDAKSWLPGSAESTKVLDIQQSFQSPDALPAVVVYDRPSGLTDADRAKAAADARQFATFEGVQGAPTGPVPSPDGKALQTLITFDLGSEGWQKASGLADQIRTVAGSGSPGLSVHVAGPLGNAADSADTFSGIDTTLLYATLGVVIGILLLTYRSPVLWLLPVVSAGVALAVAQAVIYLLAAHAGLTVNAQSAGILTVLVFGAGTDYALLLVARYREELRRHEDRHEAMAVALHRAGPAIIASGATVIVGMLCLLAAETNSTKSLGPVAAIGVSVALLVMISLLPALLVISGRWVFWPFKPHYGSAEPTTRGLWARVGNRIARRPRTVWVTTALVLGALGFGLLDLNANGLTNAESFIGHPDSIVGGEVIAQHFPAAAGAGNPVAVVSTASAAEQVHAAVAGTTGISDVTAPVVKDGHAYVQGVLNDPADSAAAYATVDRLRAAVHAVPAADAMVGGNSAVNLDLQRAAKHDRDLIIPIVLVVVTIILMALLRAIVAPLMLIATVVLSFAAALGASALVFDHVFGFAGADSSLPLFVFVFLVALGIDYNIFLMTRVHEETRRHGTRRGALIGLAATGGVITSAGAVLAGTFGVLGTLPLVFLAELGFAVALGVLLDTIVVRSVLVTALNLDIGRHIWWPSRLAKKPDVEPDELLEQPVSQPAG